MKLQFKIFTMNTKLILKTLKIAGRTTAVLLSVFMGGFDYMGMKRKAFYPTLPSFPYEKENKQVLEKQKHRFYSLVYQLKKQGFIEKKREKNKTYWLITTLGKKRLDNSNNKLSSLPKIIYKKEKDDSFNIVAFDIPEKKRFKRDWLRKKLLSLDFTMLQKSVWLGKNKLPEEFLKDLNDLELMNFVHIFKISKSGTLK